MRSCLAIRVRRALTAFCCAVAAASPGGAAPADEHRPLVFLCDQSYPPMTYQDHGQPKGVVVDVLRALGKRIGRPIDIRAMDWEEAQDLVEHGQADALCQMSITPARQQIFDFSDPVITLRFSIFAAPSRGDLSDLSDLRGLRVGVTAGGLPRALVEAEPKIRETLISDYLQGFRMIRDGRLDAVVGDQWVGTYLLAREGIADIRPSEDSVAHLPSSIAVRKGNLALLAVINQGLQSLRADGTLAGISAAWRPNEVVFETREQARRNVFYGVVGVLALLLLGAAISVVAMRREIAERKRTETALREKSELLAQSNADLEQFAYVASHDLQTPLRNIISYTQLLERRYKGRLDADGDDFIGFIVDNGKQMTRLIAGLLDYARVTSQSRPCRSLPAAEAVAQALGNLDLEIREAGAEIVVGDLPVVAADLPYLTSLFQNLLGNGLKYRGPDRPPRLSVTAEPAASGQWRFAVADNGIGIDPAYHGKIFEMFQRLDAASGPAGTGIGLTMCRRIVHRFGGRIWVESEPGRGTTVFFTLSDGSAAETPQPPRAHP